LLNKKGYTLIEILVVFFVVLGTVAMWAYILSLSHSQSGDLDKDQQYHNLSARLIQEIRKNVRSSVIFKKINESTWELASVEMDESNLPIKRTIRYEFDEKLKKVFVKKDGKVVTYDFSKVTDDKKFCFEFID
jgi:type II secretory pathway pseudopilin PulG